MKKFAALFCLGLLVTASLFAQKERKSPLMETETKVGDATVKVQYGSPAVKGRIIFGDLVPYGKVWRTGANEATIFENDKDLMIGDKTLPAGKYSLFTIPGEKEWTLIFNSNWDQWGAYKYNEKDDVIRVTGSVSTLNESAERFKIVVESDRLALQWDKTNAQVDISAK